MTRKKAETASKELPELTEDQRRRMQGYVDRMRSREAVRGDPRVQVKRVGEKGVKSGSPDGVDPLLSQIDQMIAFGTVEAEFFDRTWHQLFNAVAGGTTVVTDRQHNGLLKSMAAIEPRDEIEAMLGTQMIVAQDAVMTLMRQSNNADTIVQRDTAANLAIKFMRTFTNQMEALRRHRSPGEQRVTVQHIHVNADQAAVQVNAEGGGRSAKSEERAHAPTDVGALTDEPGTPMRSADPERDAVPVAGRSR